MNILVTINKNYIDPLKVMLWSLFFNNQGVEFVIYLIHSSLSRDEMTDLEHFVTTNGHTLRELMIADDSFADYQEISGYPKEMYYRLLAHEILPADVHKILYLDPDILIINPLTELYDLDIHDHIYAAAYHEPTIKEFNMIRLNAYDMTAYYNSGVLLMNVDMMRKKIDKKAIFAFIDRYQNLLILPDQDIINSLYGRDILKIDEIKYNYSARSYQYYKLVSNGLVDMEYVMKTTSIIHFCGKRKPWKKNYLGKFDSLYRHYQVLAARAKN